ncbi:hypothetical protein OESDEN_02264 [Oesophagostomum dentatum]|uniref:Uncharacterized protein n=1 Tax=Oesophagostomum dentatum TaxID=61180 RepID=A0A0B1TJN7_OESDE|nr:hypothetical protein OESDEN_02264 [Oesophagostomum dentatum]
MVVVTNTSYFEEDTTHVNDHPVRVLGLTKNCLVYFGWLHEIYTSIVKKPLSLRRGFTDACTDLTPFIIRTENDNKKQLLFLALKRYGRRIMVQSIARVSITETAGDLADPQNLDERVVD